jgi:DNA polymerase III delta prime subunit
VIHADVARNEHIGARAGIPAFVKTMASTMDIDGRRKTILVTNVHQLPVQHLSALKRSVEQAARCAWLVLTAMYANGIDAALQSRFRIINCVASHELCDGDDAGGESGASGNASGAWKSFDIHGYAEALVARIGQL